MVPEFLTSKFSFRFFLVLILEARDRIGGRSWTIEDAFKPGHSVELGSGWIYPDTNIFDLVQKLGIEHETTRYAFDETFGLYNSTGELLGDDKSSLIDDVYLYDFVYYAEKMAGDDVSWTEIKESYFADNYDMSDSERQAINALVHAGKFRFLLPLRCCLGFRSHFFLPF